MGKLLALLVVVIVGSSSLHADVLLFNLGSPNFDVQVSQGNFSQTSTGLVWNGDMQAADLVGGFFDSYPSPLDLSSYTLPTWQLGLALTIAGTDPDVSFTAEFFDTNFNSAVYSGSTPNIANGIAMLDFESLSDPSFDNTNVVGFQLTWGGNGTEPATTLTATKVVAVKVDNVPEPGTSGMLLMGLGLGALYMLRVKKVGRTTA